MSLPTPPTEAPPSVSEPNPTPSTPSSASKFREALQQQDQLPRRPERVKQAERVVHISSLPDTVPKSEVRQFFEGRYGRINKITLVRKAGASVNGSGRSAVIEFHHPEDARRCVTELTDHREVFPGAVQSMRVTFKKSSSEDDSSASNDRQPAPRQKPAKEAEVQSPQPDPAASTYATCAPHGSTTTTTLPVSSPQHVHHSVPTNPSPAAPTSMSLGLPYAWTTDYANRLSAATGAPFNPGHQYHYYHHHHVHQHQHALSQPAAISQLRGGGGGFGPQPFASWSHGHAGAIHHAPPLSYHVIPQQSYHQALAPQYSQVQCPPPPPVAASYLPPMPSYPGPGSGWSGYLPPSTGTGAPPGGMGPQP